MQKHLAVSALLVAVLVTTGCGQKPEPSIPTHSETPVPPAAVMDAPPAAPAAPLTLPVPLPTSGGTLRGTVTGPRPATEPEPINMSTDITCSHGRTGPVLSQKAVITETGQVQWAFVYVKTGLEGYVIPEAAEAVVLDQKGCMYSPHVFGVQTNQPIEIHNSDDTLHNVHAIPHKPNKRFNIAHPNVPGLVHRKSFTNPDVMVRIKCDVHPWMNAYVGVLPHGFSAVTGATGAYTIANLPPGEYTIGVWHEMLGEQEYVVAISADGDTTLDVQFLDS